MFSKLKNCVNCGRVFQAEEIGQKHCSRCSVNEEDLFFKVREYVYDNPDANVLSVSEELEVEEELILKWLRQGRLELRGEGVGYPCDRCGKSIKTGRFCNDCQSELTNGFQDAFGMNKKEEPVTKKTTKSNRMHVKK